MFRTLTGKGVIAAVIGLVLIGLATAFTIQSVLVLRYNSQHLSKTTIAQIRLIKLFSVNITRALGEGRTFVQAGEEDELRQAQQALEQANTALVALDPNGIEEYQEFQDEEAEFFALYERRRGLFQQARQLVESLERASPEEREEIAEGLEAIEAQFDQLEQDVDASLLRETEEISETVGQQLNLIIASVSSILAVCVIFIAGALVLLRRYIIKPIQTLSAATTTIIDGQLDQRVAITSNDEIGRLQQNFNGMTETLRDQTLHLEQQVTFANDARLEAEDSRADLAAQLATIEEQRAVIREMSVPVLPVMSGTIVMPLVGALDSDRLQLVKDQALQAIERTRARDLIFDITGVPVVDELVAQGLIRIVQAARLLGSQVMLVGIRPEVAQALVGLGVDLSFVVTESTLQSGLLAVQRRQ